MARTGPAPPPTADDGPARPRRSAAPWPLLLALALPGCETLDRMDYLDRFFETPVSQRPVFAAAEPRPDPATPAPVPPAYWTVLRPGSAAAAEPPRHGPPPAAHAHHAADEGHEPGSVVAMEPRPNPPPPASAAPDRNAQPNRARAAVEQPQPTAAAAAPPQQQADPEARTRSLVRQNPWLTRFWMELTPVQQARVERQLRRGDVVLAVESAEPAAAWDSMGLADRAALIFGRGQAPERPAPPERRDGSIWARSS